jgi:hypothetical protein
MDQSHLKTFTDPSLDMSSCIDTTSLVREGMHPAVTVTRSDRPGRKGINAWQLECPQASNFAVNPYVLSLSGSITDPHDRVSHLRVLFGAQEVTCISVERGGLWKKIQSVIAGRPHGRPQLTVKRLARRFFTGSGGAELPGSGNQASAANRGSVFDAAVPLVALPRKGTLRIEAILSGGEMQELWQLEYERPAISAPVNSQTNYPRPLSLTAIGRSGGTWAMHLLSQHPGILAIPRYPYEVTIARDIMEAAVKSCTFGIFEERLHQGHTELLRGAIKDEADDRLRHTADGASKEIVSMVGATLHGALRLIQDNYFCRSQLPFQNGKRESQPCYFIEKNMRPQRLFHELCPNAREIFLVRDFRDVICSSLAFNAKRGFLAFGREDVESDQQFVWHRAEMARPWILEPWRERCGTAFLVKYEELVQDQRACLQAILEYLELDASPGTIDGMIQRARDRQNMLEGHMTARSQEESVGRWVTDLERNLQEECGKAFGEFFSAFGYET